jgi:hypothetical protein
VPQSLLTTGGVGQGPDQRSAGRIRETLEYARACGVIDSVAHNNSRHMISTHSPLCKPFDNSYGAIYRLMSDRAGQAIPEQEILDIMRQNDQDRTIPTFGYDNRDRHRILRILNQSRLIAWRDKKVTLFQHKWGEALIGPPRRSR